MLWCDHCARDFEIPQLDNSYLCCSICGKVIFEVLFAIDPTFVKDAAGQVVPEKIEKIQTELPSDDDEDLPHISKNKIEPEEIHKDDDLGQEDDSDDVGDITGTYDDDIYYNSEGEEYDYDDDYDPDGSDW